MSLRIEDYAMIGNCETAALVGRDGSIDWLCLPRFDNAACFAAILGDESHGRWRIAPAALGRVTRRYRDGTLILETVFETETGAVRVVDCMSRRDGACDVIRRVEGVRGIVPMRSDLTIRFDYGATVPWVTRDDDGRIEFVAGPDRLVLQTGVPVVDRDMRTEAVFDIAEGEHVDFSLTWSVSFRNPPAALDAGAAIAHAQDQSLKWASRFEGAGEYSEIVLRSLITLKALTHFETGGIVAAPTTSLPERIGGPRNWDYRFCWLRDATLTLYALIESNFMQEAQAWQQWLLRAVAGSPSQLQIMYGLGGERRLDEWVIPWLPGYEASAPVRIGNAAAGQVQLDVYGEVLNALYYARVKGMACDHAAWALECQLIEGLEKIWRDPDDGIWEQRGGKKQFTHSKVMAWVAIDRAIRSAEEFGMAAPVAQWRQMRQDIHDQVCEQGFDKQLNSFVQSYGSTALDAALLMIVLVGFLPPDDPRVVGTVKAIETRLLRDGFVLRYDTVESKDGLTGDEGAFLACSFWLADNYVAIGRIDDAKALFTRLTSICNDVGLLSEEYDPVNKRQLGNFPQAFSHIALINTAFNLSRAAGDAAPRANYHAGDSSLADA